MVCKSGAEICLLDMLTILTEIPTKTVTFPSGIDFISFTETLCDISCMVVFALRGTHLGMEIFGSVRFIF